MEQGKNNHLWHGGGDFTAAALITPTYPYHTTPPPDHNHLHHHHHHLSWSNISHDRPEGELLHNSGPTSPSSCSDDTVMSSSTSGQPLPMVHHDSLQTTDLKDHNGLPLGLQTQQQHDPDRQPPVVTLLDLKGGKGAKPKNPKKYRCTYCDRAFTRSEHRSRHERSHTKEKPFHCEKCPSAFVRRDLLLRHDRTVHAVRNGQPKAANARTGAAGKTDASKKANGSTAKDSSNKRKRTSAAEVHAIKAEQQQQQHHAAAAEPNMDADFNAAFVMTALQHSYQKQHSPTNPKPLPSPPSNEYLPPLAFQPQSHGGPNALDLSTQVHHNSVKHRDGPSTSPQLGSTAAIHAASNSANQHTNQQHHHHHQQHHPISPQYSHHQHTGSNGTYSLNAFLNPVREQPGASATSSVPGAPGSSTATAATHGTTAGAGFDQPPHIPQFDATYQISSLLKFLNDDKNTLSTPPTRVQLNRYLSAYFTFFHPQLPFLHPPTFDPPNVAPSLLFAVCSIGAVLCHESAQAAVLHSNAKMLVSSIYEVDKDFPNARNTPLWAIQSLILTLVFSSWNGDPRGLEFISSVRTSVSSLATNAFYDNTIQAEPNDQSQSMHWKRWLLEESAKRALFAVFMTFGALVQMYNYPTALNNSDVPAKIQLPCSEVLWNTSFGSENDWMYHYLRETNDTCSHPQFSHALALFTQDQSHQIVQQLSPFAQKIMATALFNEVLNPQASIPRDRALSIIKGWELNARDNHPGQGQMVTQIAINSSLVCISLPMEDHMNFLFNGPSPLLTRIRAQHPLLVAGYITTLVTQVRLLVDLTSVQEVIRYHVPTDICNAALNSYTVLSTTGLLRSPSLTSLVTRCFDLYRLPSLLGLRLVKSLISTPMITANIESLLCGFELSVVLIMWCHRVEQDMANGETLDEEEAVLYSVIERTCFDCGLEKVHGQLAPALALFASELFDGETWELASILSMSLRSFGYALMPHQGAGRRMRHSSAAASSASTSSPANAYGSQQAQQQSTGNSNSAQQQPQQQQQQSQSQQQQQQQSSNQSHTHHPTYPAQSHPQSSLRTTADRDMLMMPFKPMTG